MEYNYKTRGVCSMQISFNINDDIITDVKFYGGCDGNLKAIAKLVEGLKAEEIIEKLKGNTCGYKNTSCADQLAIAVTEAKNAASSAAG